MSSATPSKFSKIEKIPSKESIFDADKNPNLLNPESHEANERPDAEYMVIRYLIDQNLTKDPLIGIANRKFYDKALREQVARVERHEKDGAKVGLIIIDIDHFKAVNDNYGHPAGDAVLKDVAKFLQDNVRTEDIVARYGGEEFAIIAPDTGLEGLAILAEKLRKIIEEKTQNKDYPPVTISVGYAEFKLVDEELNDATKLQIAADTALYNSKANGRNRTTAFTKGMTIPDKKEEESEIAPLYAIDKNIEEAADRLLQNPEKIDNNLEALRALLPEDPHESLLVIEILAKEARQAIERQSRRKTGTDDK